MPLKPPSHQPYKAPSAPDFAGIRKIRSSSKWQKVRALKLAQNPICEFCNKAEATEVHHIEPLARRIDLAYTLSNLKSACHPCHDAYEKQLRQHYYNG